MTRAQSREKKFAVKEFLRGKMGLTIIIYKINIYKVKIIIHKNVIIILVLDFNF